MGAVVGFAGGNGLLGFGLGVSMIRVVLLGAGRPPLSHLSSSLHYVYTSMQSFQYQKLESIFSSFHLSNQTGDFIPPPSHF